MSTQTATEHADRLDAKSVRTDSLTIGPGGTDLGLAWNSATPTFTNYTKGTGGTATLRWVVIGKTVHFSLFASQTSAGTCSGTVLLNLPVRARFVNAANVGSGTCNGSATNVCVSRLVSATTIDFLSLTGGSTAGPELVSSVTAAVDPATQASFLLSVNGTYEAE
jgi:hypothetical protein